MLSFMYWSRLNVLLSARGRVRPGARLFDRARRGRDTALVAPLDLVVAPLDRSDPVLEVEAG